MPHIPFTLLQAAVPDTVHAEKHAHMLMYKEDRPAGRVETDLPQAPFGSGHTGKRA